MIIVENVLIVLVPNVSEVGRSSYHSSGALRSSLYTQIDTEKGIVDERH